MLNRQVVLLAAKLLPSLSLAAIHVIPEIPSCFTGGKRVAHGVEHALHVAHRVLVRVRKAEPLSRPVLLRLLHSGLMLRVLLGVTLLDRGFIERRLVDGAA